jgi:hypothetical protein
VSKSQGLSKEDRVQLLHGSLFLLVSLTLRCWPLAVKFTEQARYVRDLQGRMSAAVPVGWVRWITVPLGQLTGGP